MGRMTVVGPAELTQYAQRNDERVLELLDSASEPVDRAFTSHRWLQESAPKRMIFSALYGDLLDERRGVRVLDVGGGYSALTRLLVLRHEYTLLDLLAHDDAERLRDIERGLGRRFWIGCDWYEHDPGKLDLVIANDLFPNVDQRLELFLDRMLPCACEVRLSLTYYDEPRFYLTRRVDADEVLVLLAWNSGQVRRALEPYVERIEQPDLDALEAPPPESLFANRRHVCLVTIRGDRA